MGRKPRKIGKNEGLIPLSSPLVSEEVKNILARKALEKRFSLREFISQILTSAAITFSAEQKKEG